jgi:hypothetical protein
MCARRVVPSQQVRFAACRSGRRVVRGREALAGGGDKNADSDARILNTALGAELEAIAAYQVGTESGLLQKPVLDLAVTFQGHHKEHADLLAKTIQRLDGKAGDR